MIHSFKRKEKLILEWFCVFVVIQLIGLIIHFPWIFRSGAPGVALKLELLFQVYLPDLFLCLVYQLIECIHALPSLLPQLLANTVINKVKVKVGNDLRGNTHTYTHTRARESER